VHAGSLDTTDTGSDAVVVTDSIENKPSSTTMTATADTAATATLGEGEDNNVSLEASKMVHRPPEKEIIPELPSATANAFTQLVRCSIVKYISILFSIYRLPQIYSSLSQG